MARWTIKTRRGGLVVILAIVLGGLAMAVGVPIYYRFSGAPSPAAQVERLQREILPLLASVALPPGAEPRGDLREGFTHRRGVTVWVEREYTVPGSFAEALAWHEPRLAAQGWKPYERANWRGFVARFCRAPWVLELADRGDFSRSRPPHHRLKLRLDWYGGVTERDCASS
ncbi:MAG: hypothetical protein JNM29_10750 [Candidatus Odyssella sp.]|nr:hypothetical protein [Candidatus Odyssella sp.]